MVKDDETAYKLIKEIENLLCEHYDFVIELHKTIERSYEGVCDIKDDINYYSTLIDQANVIYKYNKHRLRPDVKVLSVWRDVLKFLLFKIGSHKKYQSINQLLNLFKTLKTYLPKQLDNLGHDENFINLRNEFLSDT
jgi:hypothetical protein